MDRAEAGLLVCGRPRREEKQEAEQEQSGGGDHQERAPDPISAVDC
jgi:hypothetical protein